MLKDDEECKGKNLPLIKVHKIRAVHVFNTVKPCHFNTQARSNTFGHVGYSLTSSAKTSF